jgi:hypothetical protein
MLFLTNLQSRCGAAELWCGARGLLLCPRRRRSHAHARLSYFVDYDEGPPFKFRASASSATPAEASSEEQASFIDALRLCNRGHI